MATDKKWPEGKIAVIGFARTGEAVARAAKRHGTSIVAIDDQPSEGAAQMADDLGVEFVVAPSPSQLYALVKDCVYVVVSPGVPPSHPIFAVASKDQLISEIELAYLTATAPILAITGTNGKTTVTTLVNQMMLASGIRSTAAGNIGPTLIDASAREDLDAIVAEVSSFQLAMTKHFRPRVATWLNFAEDHLDWHPDMDDYANAKAKIFSAQQDSDVAVVNINDPVVMAASSHIAARVVTFGGTDADYFVRAGHFRTQEGADLGRINLLPRVLPHDLDNALAALATALEAGATIAGCRQALAHSVVLPHRVEFVERIDEVDFYDDSKATTPSAVLAAMGSFSSLVLIAGGKNKGLNLSPLRSFADVHPEIVLRGVIVIGEAAPQLKELFSPTYTVRDANSMSDAVRAAQLLAEPGDVVLLSPGCASFDWYRSYAERGEDFVRCVHELTRAGG
jgi:UDP-N-acetylmuramoylalanine--D-glutamate ligase